MSESNGCEFPINTLQVIGFLGAGGDTTTVLNAMSTMEDKGIHFDFLTHQGSHQDTIDMLRESGHRVLILPGDARVMKVNYPKAFINVVADAHVRYDAVHVHTSMQSGLALYAAKRLGVAHRICHSHIGAIQRETSDIQRALLVPALRAAYLHYATQRVACSRVAGDFLFGDYKYDVIYNGVDSRRFSQTSDVEINNVRKDFGCTDDTILVGHVAHFSSPKNQAFTLDLAASMLDYPQYRFVFVGGQGEDFDKVVSEAACRGLEKKVIFAGQRSDMPQVMSALDCLVLPSLPGEGFPMTVVEAVAAGTPCIVSDNVTAETQMLGSEFVSRCSLCVGDWANALLHIGRKTPEMRSMGPLRISQCHLDLESFGKAWRNLYRWDE